MDKRPASALIKTLSLVCALSLTLAACSKPASDQPDPSAFPRVIVIGVDGMDPKITRSLMDQGKLLNFARLAAQGGMSPIQTTNPAQSPVAWSTIGTGANPGEHGMFDFLWRHEENYLPDLSLAEMQSPRKKIKLFGQEFPLERPFYKSHRQGTPVWALTSQKNIPTVVLRWPVTFPPEKVHGKMLSGMGVPDARGTQGTFSFYTSEVPDNDRPQGGVIVPVGERDVIQTQLLGPRGPRGGELAIPLEIRKDPQDRSITLKVRDHSFTVKERAWSQWVRVKFSVDAFKGLPAMCRFYLKSFEKPFELYCSPMNYDPQKPLFPISYESDYSKKLQAEIGDFHTLGMPHDTWALNEGRMDEDMFLSQTDAIVAEEKAMVLSELKEYKSGLLMIVFETVDRISHMFWRYTDPESPLYDPEGAKKYGGVIEHYYVDMDNTLGEILKYVDDKTTLIVSSDHGFTNFRRTVHINTCLVRSGQQELQPGVSEGRALFRDVDWSRTKAYAVGLGSVYINLEGRESKGIVKPGQEKTDLENEIIRNLEALTDPKSGAKVVHKVYKRDEIYSGRQIDKMPDLVVAFEAGYRASWQTALGASPQETMEDNLKKWSGDHIVEPSLVPGTFFSNRKLPEGRMISLYDIAPTVLQEFGITPPEDYLGEPIFLEKLHRDGSEIQNRP